MVSGERKTLFLTSMMLVTVLCWSHPAAAARNESECRACHCDRTILERGARLYIDPLRFGETTHKQIGCPACHESVTERHPEDGVKPAHATCSSCHDGISREYAASLHGRNASCSDCHNPHQARKPAYTSGDDINAVCSRCHAAALMLQQHQHWLPQTALHLSSLPCVTCHTGSRDYYINLFVEKREPSGSFRLATYDELVRMTGEGGLPSLIDTNGDTFISQQELRRFNMTMRGAGMRLRGMMMPEVITHGYQILENRWDCSFCHASGNRVMQTGFVSFPSPTGSYRRIPVERGALMDLLYGTPDFYMTGVNRNMVLSIIGGLIIVGGTIMPVGHGFVRYLTRRRREHEVHRNGREVIVYLQPVPIRSWHWVHALCIVTLCATGVQIRFPETVNLFGSYKGAVALHNTAGIVTGVSMVWWLLYYVVISRTIGRIYFPTGDELRHGVLRQVIFYFFNYFRGKPNPFHATPENKFNALQKLAYLVIMLVFMPLVILSGLLLLDVQPLRAALFDMGGIKLIDGIHFLTACGLCAFLFTHIYLTTLGPTPFSEIRTMWTGWEKEEEDAAPPGPE